MAARYGSKSPSPRGCTPAAQGSSSAPTPTRPSGSGPAACVNHDTAVVPGWRGVLAGRATGGRKIRDGGPARGHGFSRFNATSTRPRKSLPRPARRFSYHRAASPSSSMRNCRVTGRTGAEPRVLGPRSRAPRTTGPTTRDAIRNRQSEGGPFDIRSGREDTMPGSRRAIIGDTPRGEARSCQRPT